ncbi:MAG TPA: PLDc N-terminal domain-containing protein [Chthoniobacterales bacterium]
MNRLPLLVISLLFFVMSGALVYLFFSFNSASPEQQQSYFSSLLRFFPLGIVIAAFAGFILWISALIHMLMNRSLVGNDKIVWVLVIIFLNALGALLYFILLPFIQNLTRAKPINE